MSNKENDKYIDDLIDWAYHGDEGDDEEFKVLREADRQRTIPLETHKNNPYSPDLVEPLIPLKSDEEQGPIDIFEIWDDDKYKELLWI